MARGRYVRNLVANRPVVVTRRRVTHSTVPAHPSTRPAPFGAIPLDKLQSDVEALVLAMRAKTKPGVDGSVRALSDSTIRQTYTILRAGLDGAVRDGLLARNPAALIKRPGIERTEAKHFGRRRHDRGSESR